MSTFGTEPCYLYDHCKAKTTVTCRFCGNYCCQQHRNQERICWSCQ